MPSLPPWVATSSLPQWVATCNAFYGLLGGKRRRMLEAMGAEGKAAVALIEKRDKAGLKRWREEVGEGMPTEKMIEEEREKEMFGFVMVPKKTPIVIDLTECQLGDGCQLGDECQFGANCPLRVNEKVKKKEVRVHYKKKWRTFSVPVFIYNIEMRNLLAAAKRKEFHAHDC